MPGTDIRDGKQNPAILLRTWYAMSGTEMSGPDIGYVHRSKYPTFALATRCLVLTYRMLLGGRGRG